MCAYIKQKKRISFELLCINVINWNRRCIFNKLYRSWVLFYHLSFWILSLSQEMTKNWLKWWKRRQRPSILLYNGNDIDHSFFISHLSINFRVLIASKCIDECNLAQHQIVKIVFILCEFHSWHKIAISLQHMYEHRQLNTSCVLGIHCSILFLCVYFAYFSFLHFSTSTFHPYRLRFTVLISLFVDL